jgi:hypothetical protein
VGKLERLVSQRFRGLSRALAVPPAAQSPASL